MREMVSERTVTELVRAAADGDGRAWGEIVVRYGDLVRATVAGFRLQQADAADAVQNTWLRALERIGTVREPERLGGWLTTVARRHTWRRRVEGSRASAGEHCVPRPGRGRRSSSAQGRWARDGRSDHARGDRT